MTETLRPARPSDAPAIARIYVAGWQDAYPGLLPDRLLVGMRRTDGRAERWAGTIRHPARGERIMVAEAEDGAVIGFAGGGPARARDSPHSSVTAFRATDPLYPRRCRCCHSLR